VSQNPVKPGDTEKTPARPAVNQGRRTIEECPLWVISRHGKYKGKGDGKQYAYKGRGDGHYDHYKRSGRHGNYRRYAYGLPYISYGYGGGCSWLRSQALITGSPYWWNRYYQCRGYYY
jgi:hypothetical protein